MKVINLAQGSPEWLTWRKGGLTASDAAVLLDVSDKKTVWRLWMEKTGRTVEPDISRNPNVRRGKRMESVARDRLEAELNLGPLLPVCVEWEKNPLFRASLDGVDQGGRPTELKSPSEKVWDDILAHAENSVAYRRYVPQVQEQLLVIEATEGILAFLSPDGTTCRHFVVVRDDGLIQKIIEAGERFWAEHIVADKEPTPDPKRDLFVPTGGAATHWRALAKEYLKRSERVEMIKTGLAALNVQQESIKKTLVEMMGEFLMADAEHLAVTRYARKGAVDYKRLLQENKIEVDSEKYRKRSTEGVRITIHEEAGIALNFGPRNEGEKKTPGNSQGEWFY
jgi:putative phage-type endonuclease